MTTRRHGVLLGALVLLAGCGSSSGHGSTGATGAATSASPASGQVPAATAAATSEPATTGVAAASSGELAAPGPGDADLRVVIYPTGSRGQAVRWRVRCGADGPWAEPDGPAAPADVAVAIDAGAACAAVLAHPEAFSPPAGSCARVATGGPSTARADGTVAGAPVKASFSRHDTCAVARWDALADLLGGSGSPAPDPA